MTDNDYSACGLRLIVRGDPNPGTYQVGVYCDRPYDHNGNHRACIEWDDSTSRRVAQGSFCTAAKPASKAPSSPVETTAGSEQRQDHTGVIRPADEAERLEAACEIMHNAYEAAAPAAGWKTQEASRKEWADVPEANKVTMRAAVGAVLRWIDAEHSRERQGFKAAIAQRDATIERLWAQLNEATNVPAIARRCSTCGEPMDSPGCSTSPESKDAYPRGFHTVSGGVGQTKP